MGKYGMLLKHSEIFNYPLNPFSKIPLIVVLKVYSMYFKLSIRKLKAWCWEFERIKKTK